MNDTDPAVRTEAEQTLTHGKHCTFVHLVAPDPKTAQAVMTFGAYGSTMEGELPQPFPSPFQYIAPAPGSTPRQLAELAARLPPFYTTGVGVAPMQVLDPDLLAAVIPLLPPPPQPPA